MNAQLAPKQYSNPAPPVDTRFCLPAPARRMRRVPRGRCRRPCDRDGRRTRSPSPRCSSSSRTSCRSVPGKRASLRVRARQDVVHVRRVARAVHRSRPFSVSAFILLIWLRSRTMSPCRSATVRRDHRALGVVPRARADAIARVDRTAVRSRGAEICAPLRFGAMACPTRRRARRSARRRRRARQGSRRRPCPTLVMKNDIGAAGCCAAGVCAGAGFCASRYAGPPAHDEDTRRRRTTRHACERSPLTVRDPRNERRRTYRPPRTRSISPASAPFARGSVRCCRAGSGELTFRHAGAHERRDLGAEQLDRAHHVAVRHPHQLDEVSRVPEDLVLEEDLLGHLLGSPTSSARAARAGRTGRASAAATRARVRSCASTPRARPVLVAASRGARRRFRDR